jgi:hypothetical protein
MLLSLDGHLLTILRIGITLTAILIAAGMPDASGGPAKFYSYRMDPALPEAVRLQRAKRLTKNPVNHLKLAEASARLAGMDADETVLKLAAGTSLAPGAEDIIGEARFDHLDMLSAAIQGDARRIVNTLNLDWYFGTLEDHALVPVQGGWEVNAFPGLLQYACPVVELMTLRKDKTVFRGVWQFKDDATTGGSSAKASVCSRIGLALAPFGSDKSVRAYFVTRTVVEVCAELPRRDEFFICSRQHYCSLPVEDGIARNADGTFHPVQADLGRFSDLALPHPQDACGEWDWDFDEVTPATIASVIDGAKGTRAPTNADALFRASDVYTKSPPETCAAALERALLWGNDGKPETRLMSLLEADACARASSLRAWIDERMAHIEDAMVRMANGEGL